MPILIGADPELFVREEQTNRMVPGFDLIPGTKQEPHKVNNGAVQVDGMALEFNIDPSRSLEEFVDNITSVQQQLQEMVAGKNYHLVAEPVAEFNQEDLNNLPGFALELGCEPDYNAWLYGQENYLDPSASFLNWRTGAGHVHIGWTEGVEDIFSIEHRMACIELVQELDYYLGVPSLLWDTDTKRREMYGAPGCYRPKPYGLEYRTLSNAWLRREEYTRQVYLNTKLAAKNYFDTDYRFVSEYGQSAKDWMLDPETYQGEIRAFLNDNSHLTENL
tara:strand:+ start:3431 stop:4258 length:828 start_codon:yes stop_codon:yes gene_type:complete